MPRRERDAIVSANYVRRPERDEGALEDRASQWPSAPGRRCGLLSAKLKSFTDNFIDNFIDCVGKNAVV